MGYVEPAFAAPGTEMTIDIRGNATPARVVELPFYRRGRVDYRRRIFFFSSRFVAERNPKRDTRQIAVRQDP